MAISALDTRQTVKDLTAAGFTDAQAEALTSALRQQIDLSDLATKSELRQEIAELRSAMKLEFANVRREIAEMKTEWIKWVLGSGLAQVAAIVAILKLFPGGH